MPPDLEMPALSEQDAAERSSAASRVEMEAAGIEPALAQCHCAVIPFHHAPALASCFYRSPQPPKAANNDVAPRYRPGSFWSSARRATSTPERQGMKLPGLESNQRPPVSETGLRTGTECQARRSGPHGRSPSPGSTRFRCVPARLSRGPRCRGSPLLVRSPGEPDGDRTSPEKQKTPRSSPRAGLPSIEGSFTSFVHPAPRAALSAPAHGRARSPTSTRPRSSLGRR